MNLGDPFGGFALIRKPRVLAVSPSADLVKALKEMGEERFTVNVIEDTREAIEVMRRGRDGALVTIAENYIRDFVDLQRALLSSNRKRFFALLIILYTEEPHLPNSDRIFTMLPVSLKVPNRLQETIEEIDRKEGGNPGPIPLGR